MRDKERNIYKCGDCFSCRGLYFKSYKGDVYVISNHRHGQPSKVVELYDKRTNGFRDCAEVENPNHITPEEFKQLCAHQVDDFIYVGVDLKYVCSKT